MNITLIYPLLSRQRSKIDENKQFWPPLGLAYIAAVLERNNHHVKIIDRDVILHKNRFDFEKVDNITLKEIELHQTQIVGISATTPNMGDVRQLSEVIKKQNPNLKIVLGGPHATCTPHTVLETCKDIDVVVRGEGEFTMLDLANNRDIEKINGISFRKDGQIIDNPDRNHCQNLDELPYPARRLLDMEFYTRPSRFMGRGLNLKATSIFTARGCPYRCDFCAGHLIFPGSVRFHSPARIIKEMEDLVLNYSVKAFYFAEDMFLANKRRVMEFIELLKENPKLKDVKWIAQARADIVDMQLLSSLKDAGCVGLEYGFESGSQRMLDIMNKGTRVEENVTAAMLTHKANLRFTGFIIVGYSGETEEDFKKTISFLKKVKPSTISLSLFYPLPGTAIYKRLVSSGAKIPEWDRIGDPEAADINYADMDKNKFQRLYFKARLMVVLPNNLRYFIKDNIRHPLVLMKIFMTQFKGVIIRSSRAIGFLLRAKGACRGIS